MAIAKTIQGKQSISHNNNQAIIKTMELIKTLRERSQTQRQANIQRLAEETICLSDFDGDIYIAYNGTPLVPINKDSTTKEIIEKLSRVRQNFINSRLKECGLPKIAAAL